MINIQNLRMTYRSGREDVIAVSGVDLDIRQGQFFTLLGPSGCGKTTTLRCVAGLEQPDEGEIFVGDELVFSSAKRAWVPPFRRNIGMVFQSYAIWPHMSVFENVAFPLLHERNRPSRKVIRERVLKALASVKLEKFVDRPAPYLSGGQQQRLALARALVGEPRVLLLDEPLSNLDAKLREEMRVELRDLAKRLNVTTLFVTHEQVEALTMSDTIAVMKDGHIVQAGTPEEIYAKPQTAFVAQFIGRTNLIPGQIVSNSAGGSDVAVETAIGTLRCRSSCSLASRASVVISIRPEDLTIVPQGVADGGANIVAGRVERLLYLGETLDCFIRVGGQLLHMKLHPAAAPPQGSLVTLSIPAAGCLALKNE